MSIPDSNGSIEAIPAQVYLIEVSSNGNTKEDVKCVPS